MSDLEAGSSAQIEAKATGTDGPVVELPTIPRTTFPAVHSQPLMAIPREAEKGQSVAIPRKPAKSKKSTISASRLEITESASKTGKAWTVSLGGKGRGRGAEKLRLRVRPSDAGFSVSARFKDQTGKWREPYACYLAAGEWRSARGMTPSGFADFICRKIEQRRNEGADPEKVDLLLEKVGAFR